MIKKNDTFKSKKSIASRRRKFQRNPSQSMGSYHELGNCGPIQEISGSKEGIVCSNSTKNATKKLIEFPNEIQDNNRLVTVEDDLDEEM